MLTAVAGDVSGANLLAAPFTLIAGPASSRVECTVTAFSTVLRLEWAISGWPVTRIRLAVHARPIWRILSGARAAHNGGDARVTAVKAGSLTVTAPQGARHADRRFRAT